METGKAMQSLKGTDTRARTHDAGFSIIELMVVVFVIGLVASFIVLSAPRQGSDLVRNTERVASLLSQASDEAVVSGNAYGAVFEGNTVQIVRRDDGIWNRSATGVVHLPAELSVSRVSGGDQARPDAAPDIWFDPIGMTTPARIEVSDGRQIGFISIRADGSVAAFAGQPNER